MIKLSLIVVFFLLTFLSVIMLGVFCLFYQNVVKTLINEIIKVYKYAYKYNRVFILSGLSGLAIQPALWLN